MAEASTGRVYVGRQPIVDALLEPYGYELLFRDGADSDRATQGGDLATTQVIVNTFTEFGLESLVGLRRAFVNVTRAFVTGVMPVPLPPQSSVLELLETIGTDEPVQEGARRLAGEGFLLALDDFVWSPEAAPLLDLATFVKIDVLGRGIEQVAADVDRCRPYGVRLVAERVETREHLEVCRELGFELFQGHLLSRPDVVGTAAIAPTKLTCLHLLGQLSQPELSLEEVERLVTTDVALTYRTLRAANSASVASRRRIASVRDALVLLGLNQLRSWLVLLTLSSTEPASDEQLQIAMTRARACELLAEAWPGVQPPAAFTVGLLSSLDFLVGLGMPDVVARLNLQEELAVALVDRAGPLGRVLAAVVAHERGAAVDLDDAPVSPFDVSRAFLTAVGWSLATYSTVLEAG